MNTLVCRTAFAATLALLHPAFAADAVPPASPPPHFEFVDALESVSNELRAATQQSQRNFNQQIDRLSGVEFSDDTKQRLLKVFGSTHPATLKRVAAPKGKLGYRFELPGGSFAEPSGATIAWSAFTGNAVSDLAGRTLRSDASWPSLTLDSKELHMAVRELSMTGDHRRGTTDAWLGDFGLNIASISAHGVDTPFTMSINDIALTTNTVQHGKTVDVRYDSTIKRIEAQGDGVDDVHFAMRFSHLDVDALNAFSHGVQKNHADQLPPAKKLEAMLPMFKTLGKNMAAHGSALEIGDFSARYHGLSAALKGRIEFVGAKDSDFDSISALSKKIVAQFDIRVPVALVKDISRSFARKQLAATPGATSDEAAVDNVAQIMTDTVLGKLLGAGYARNEQGMLVSKLVYRDGKLSANGTDVKLGAPGAPAIAHAGAPTGFDMPARAVRERCPPPALPAQAQRQQLTLRATTSFIVGADGHVRDVRITDSSKWPEFDGAVLASTAACYWIPALRGGREVDIPMTQTYEVKPEPAASEAR